MVVTLAMLEGAFLFAALCGMTVLWKQSPLTSWIDVGAILRQAFILSLCWIVAFYYNDLYNFRAVRNLYEFISRLLRSLLVAVTLLAALSFLSPATRITTELSVSSLLLSLGLLLSFRAVSYGIMQRQPFLQRILILGTSPLARKLLTEIEAQPHIRCAMAGGPDDSSIHRGRNFSYPSLPPTERLTEIIKEFSPDRIIVALPERRGHFPVEQLLDARIRGIIVEDGVDVYERMTGKIAIESLTPSSLIFSKDLKKSRWQLGLRRSISLVAAVVGLFLAAPIMFLIALGIKLESSGRICFIQERAGLRGRIFRLTKFRTMYEARDEKSSSIWERNDGHRVTRLGRWLRRLRLDELPQLWNIVKGDMDLVGPRPEMACNVGQMAEQIPYYSFRHTVRPGITGWAQVRHGYSVSLEEVAEKVRYDLYYIKHMSLWLDLRILLDTVKIVLLGRGVGNDQCSECRR